METELDWESPETRALRNPRMPVEEARTLEQALVSVAPLPAHFWVATSGSSGRIKWVALSKSAVLASALAVNRHLESDSRDVWLHALPEFHVGGLGIRARAHLSGARVSPLASARWDPVAYREQALREGATLSALVPTQLYDLVRAGLSGPPALRAIVIGGAALNDTLYAQARGLGWNVLPSFGMTECCSQIATAGLKSLREAPSEMPAPRLLSHVEARIADTGVLEIRSPALLTGIAEFDEQGKARFHDPKRDGWYCTEDRATVSDGALNVLGRSSSFVKVGGESVDLNRLERIMEELKLEARCTQDLALLAVPDPRLGACIELAAAGASLSPEAEAVLKALRERLLPFERPRKIHYLLELPRSSLGKLLRSELQKRVLSESSTP